MGTFLETGVLTTLSELLLRTVSGGLLLRTVSGGLLPMSIGVSRPQLSEEKKGVLLPTDPLPQAGVFHGLRG
jgi:hypothetical protein